MTTFSELYQAHARDVFRFALFLSGDPDLAEDIVSETYIRLWHARARVDLSTVKAYLLAIARNLFLEQKRRAVRRTDLHDEHADARPGPETAAASRSELQAVLVELQKCRKSTAPPFCSGPRKGCPTPRSRRSWA